MIGDSYDKGLGMLKPMVEKAAALRIAEAKRAAAEAEKKRLIEEAAAGAESEAEEASQDPEASSDSP